MLSDRIRQAMIQPNQSICITNRTAILVPRLMGRPTVKSSKWVMIPAGMWLVSDGSVTILTKLTSRTERMQYVCLFLLDCFPFLMEVNASRDIELTRLLSIL